MTCSVDGLVCGLFTNSLYHQALSYKKLKRAPNECRCSVCTKLQRRQG